MADRPAVGWHLGHCWRHPLVQNHTVDTLELYSLVYSITDNMFSFDFLAKTWKLKLRVWSKSGLFDSWLDRSTFTYLIINRMMLPLLPLLVASSQRGGPDGLMRELGYCTVSLV